MKFMLDTNICILLLRGPSEGLAQKTAMHIVDDICVSAITVAELEYGVWHSSKPEYNAQLLLQFLSTMRVFDFNSKAAVEYGSIRNELARTGQTIGPLDMLIAGHAKSLGLTVVTNNTREFARVSDLSVEDWSLL